MFWMCSLPYTLSTSFSSHCRASTIKPGGCTSVLWPSARMFKLGPDRPRVLLQRECCSAVSMYDLFGRALLPSCLPYLRVCSPTRVHSMSVFRGVQMASPLKDALFWLRLISHWLSKLKTCPYLSISYFGKHFPQYWSLFSF